MVIDKIQVNKPIRFTSVRRNEVKSKISASNVLQAYNGADKELYLSNKRGNCTAGIFIAV